MNRNEFIKEVANKIKREELSLFFGSGLSNASGLPCWKQLFMPLADALGVDIDEIDGYDLAQYYCNQKGKAELLKNISQALPSGVAPSDTLDLFLDLMPSAVWTTNYDQLIEDALKKKRKPFSVIQSDENLSSVSRKNSTTIYKMNGDINNLNKMILTNDDWENYQHTHPTMITFLKKELVSTSFLFYGYSFTDNLVKNILANILQFVGKSNCNYHYNIQKKNVNDKSFNLHLDDLEKRYNVKTLLVDDYSEVNDILHEIRKEVIKNNVFISGRMGDLATSEELVIANFCKELTLNLLQTNFNICTGMGRKIGYFIAGPSIQYLLQENKSNIEKRLSIRPFDDLMSKEYHTQYRKLLLSDNNIVIFIYGKHSDGSNSKGMFEEYKIAVEQKKIIIPLAITGSTALQIWEDVKNNITEFPYLEPYIDQLNNNNLSNADLFKVIKSIISSLHI